MGSGRPDLIITCECGAGTCTVGPLLFNQQCLFICCPQGLANGGGCGFMQWRDPNKITTWHSHHDFPPPPPLFTTTIPITDTIAEEYAPPFTAAEEDTPPPPPMTASQDVPPPPPPMTASQDVPPPPPSPPQTMAMMCPCGAGPCSIGTTKNGHNFYSCSSCKFRKWCDAESSSQCYICRKEGHWYMDCPRLSPSVAASAANNKKIICFYCKLEGHYVSQCPFKSQRRQN